MTSSARANRDEGKGETPKHKPDHRKGKKEDKGLAWARLSLSFLSSSLLLRRRERKREEETIDGWIPVAHHSLSLVPGPQLNHPSMSSLRARKEREGEETGKRQRWGDGGEDVTTDPRQAFSIEK